jgi:hypothetical protein
MGKLPRLKAGEDKRLGHKEKRIEDELHKSERH